MHRSLLAVSVLTHVQAELPDQLKLNLTHIYACQDVATLVAAGPKAAPMAYAAGLMGGCGVAMVAFHLSLLEKSLPMRMRSYFCLQPCWCSQDFYKISHALKELGVKRSTGQCVAFFYRTQKLDEFANVRRKQQLKKRRLQSDLNRSVTYMGMSSARRGDALVTSAVRASESLSVLTDRLNLALAVPAFKSYVEVALR